uniref:4-alpha-glucanotransferase n=1 Tax=Elaeis guineensis var. tenera TaxID=51953 RepID=A0A6J0PFZ2_ELAGV|nr:laccase-19 isoform X6 [Elaeis guineensis]XP_019704725.2 laccase-19 isoform X6 [Elaeis guineensis]XP_019704726.2 laccase-19 isoform X6 [Elaeis guineensis]XP_019704727.2 laccase-19 isoform X6 [Elaeis guineensis]XP_019704730.2 laccase-19 isoform X6 [Elaeis guineensis]XP_029119369.1 laccase-19 isoform X6 [Elaeis guineensis]
MESVLSLVMVVFYGLLFCPGWCETYHHVFYVKEASYTRLCGTKKMMTVNGQFPGPTLYANRGDELVIKVFNYAHCILWCHLQSFGKINILAEDLGVITEDVVQLRKAIGAPGMAVLQFASGSGSDNLTCLVIMSKIKLYTQEPMIMTRFLVGGRKFGGGREV